MFSIDDVRIPIRIMLEPGIYTCGNISANGKTKLLNLCKEYGIAGFPVYGYTYNDFLNHVPFSVQEDIWLVFIDRYDLLKEQFAPQFYHWQDVIFMVYCMTDCAALEDSQECYINMESDRITVWNV